MTLKGIAQSARGNLRKMLGIRNQVDKIKSKTKRSDPKNIFKNIFHNLYYNPTLQIIDIRVISLIKVHMLYS